MREKERERGKERQRKRTIHICSVAGSLVSDVAIVNTREGGGGPPRTSQCCPFADPLLLLHLQREKKKDAIPSRIHTVWHVARDPTAEETDPSASQLANGVFCRMGRPAAVAAFQTKCDAVTLAEGPACARQRLILRLSLSLSLSPRQTRDDSQRATGQSHLLKGGPVPARGDQGAAKANGTTSPVVVAKEGHHP